eukprot:1147097-Pelagomonas_calceolata.AAC.2
MEHVWARAQIAPSEQAACPCAKRGACFVCNLKLEVSSRVQLIMACFYCPLRKELSLQLKGKKTVLREDICGLHQQAE